MEKTIMVKGMTCGHCEKAVKDALAKLQGVNSVDVNLDTGKVVVEGQGMKDEELEHAVIESGYEVVSVS